jgi:hypothetical protein
MNDPGLSCGEDLRHEKVRTAPEYGLDFLEVSDDQRTLHVVFLGQAPDDIDIVNVVIEGGRRIRDVAVVGVDVHRHRDPTVDDSMDVEVDKYGDFSTYTLRVVKLDEDGHPTKRPMDGFDPRYAAIEFSFKAGCPSDLDCRTPPSCPPPVRPQPAISYLAKDYQSFRQLILDRLALIMPEWGERHVPDIGITVVELLAYVGDYLSYYQDAVATEAYLGTARQRISVRRHARLVDYAMHEGCNARAWVTIWSDEETRSFDPRELYFITGFPGAPRDLHVLASKDLPPLTDGSYEVFEPVQLNPQRELIRIYEAHNEIHFYIWENRQCCLAVGTTAATLVDPGTTDGGTPVPPDPATGTGYALHLCPGDVLIFEEMMGPRTGVAADADPLHRQAVRLTKVTRALDPLNGTALVEIEWASDDALTFALCLSSRAEETDCCWLNNVSVAHGNVVLVDHGARVLEEVPGEVCTASTQKRCPTECDPGDTTTVAAPFHPALRERPLTFAERVWRCASARALATQDPRRAVAAIMLNGTTVTARGQKVHSRWWAKADLLESGSGDQHFVAEIDNDGVAHLRFGDGRLGRMPAADTSFHARYRIGNGIAGNVGADCITYMVFRDVLYSGTKLMLRNPLPACGGTDPESLEEVKRFAPGAFRKVLQRAITADDYATLAEDNDRRRRERSVATGTGACPPSFRELLHAKARLHWTGGWYEARVAIDPRGSEDSDADLVADVLAYLEPYRRVGHDLVVAPASYVPLDLAMTICVLPQFLRGHVEAALLDAFSTRALPDGRLGFFHPDRWTFDDDVAVSRIVAAAQTVPGVASVQVTRLRRYRVGTRPQRPHSPPQVPAGGVLKLGSFEIAQLDDDPTFPERGRLVLNLEGGR